MASVYIIKHLYDVDGGFGDAVSQETIVGITTDKVKAEQYVEKWSAPFVYDTPYADLECSRLVVEEVEADDFDLDTRPRCSWYLTNPERFPEQYAQEQAAKAAEDAAQEEEWRIRKLQRDAELAGCTFTPDPGI